MFLLNRNPHVSSTNANRIPSISCLTSNFLRVFFAALLSLTSLQALADADVLISTFTDTPDPAARGGIISGQWLVVSG